MNTPTAVEYYFPPNDEHTWYPIKGFPSYQISIPDYFLRSYKNVNSYPYGQLKKIDKKGYVTVTDCNNFARKVHMDTLIKLLDLNDPHGTFAVYFGPPRNQRLFIDESEFEGIGEVVRKPSRINNKDGMTSMVHFKTI